MWLARAITTLWLVICAAAGEPGVNSEGIRSIPVSGFVKSKGEASCLQELAPYTQFESDSDMQSRWFDFGGNTIIRADQYIRLTSDRPSQEGWIFSRVPLTATNWEIEFEFKIHGNSNLHGDGFAMWLTKSRATAGEVFGAVDNFEGLGIFFDTYKNNRPGTIFPIVMAMVGDGKTPYDKHHDGKANEFKACSARGIRDTTVPTKARLTYFQDKSLKLELQYKAEGLWELCFETDQPPSIPSVTYLGFSAETGELSDNHDIISVNTKNLYNTNGRPVERPKTGMSDGEPNTKAKARKRQGGSWTWLLVKSVGVLMLLGGCYIGWTAWRTHQKKGSRF